MKIKKAKPRVMIAAPASGSGKTMVTMGILSYLQNENRNVICYKCGPDYIDPMFHKKVLGISGGNLDTYFTGDEYINYRLGSTDCDCIVVEGAMGIYDGLGGIKTDASCYDIARAGNIPVVLVIDCHGCGRTILSVIKGILSDDENHLIKGIILNRMSAALYDSLRESIEKILCEASQDIRLIGYIPRIKNLNVGSRHLGLVMPNEIKDIREQIEAIEEALRESLDFSALDDVINNAGDVEYEEYAGKSGGETLTLARAYDEAFCFYYEENMKELADRGVKIIDFSPIHDDKLPEGIDGLLLGGGYPELYLRELSDNYSMKKSIRDAITGGIPSLAECGGFMYLHDHITENNESYEMAGVIEGECVKKDALVRFGYIGISCPDAAEESGDALLKALEGIKGHEFHYYDSSNNGSSVTANKPIGSRSWKCIHSGENHIWGFPHLYYPSKPEFVCEFINQMKRYGEKRDGRP